MAKYRLTPLALDKKSKTGFIGVRINGEHVNLIGDEVKITIDATKEKPKSERIYRKCTEKDWEYWYNLGHQKIIEKIEDEPKTIESKKG